MFGHLSYLCVVGAAVLGTSFAHASDYNPTVAEIERLSQKKCGKECEVYLSRGTLVSVTDYVCTAHRRSAAVNDLDFARIRIEHAGQRDTARIIIPCIKPSCVRAETTLNSQTFRDECQDLIRQGSPNGDGKIFGEVKQDEWLIFVPDAEADLAAQMLRTLVATPMDLAGLSTQELARKLFLRPGWGTGQPMSFAYEISFNNDCSIVLYEKSHSDSRCLLYEKWYWLDFRHVQSIDVEQVAGRDRGYLANRVKFRMPQARRHKSYSGEGCVRAPNRIGPLSSDKTVSDVETWEVQPVLHTAEGAALLQEFLRRCAADH